MQWKKIYKIHQGLECNWAMQKEFCNKLGLNRCSYYDHPVSLRKLLNGDRSYNSGTHADTSPFNEGWKDHLEIYREQGTNRIILASQPYKEPKEILSELVQLASKLKIRVVVFGKEHSWYYKNATCLVLLMSENTYESSKAALSEIGDYWNINALSLPTFEVNRRTNQWGNQDI